MIWVIEYNDGSIITENQTNFQHVDKQNVKYLYFLDQSFNNVYGINLEKMQFFVNNKTFDFKIKGTHAKLIQHKTASIHFGTELNHISSWNLGVEIISSQYMEKYMMSININNEVFLTAIRKELKSGKVDEKQIRLQ